MRSSIRALRFASALSGAALLGEAVLGLAPALAQTRVTVTPSQSQVEPGQSVDFTVEIDIPLAPPNRPDPSRPNNPYLPGEEAIFDIRLSYSGAYPGDLKPGAISGGEWLYPPTRFRAFAQFDPSQGSWRARTVAKYSMTILAQAAGGSVTVAAEGGQGGLLGSRQGNQQGWQSGSSGAGARFTGSAQFLIKSGRGAGVREPPARPPFTKSGGADNPTKEIISIVTLIGIVLAGIGLVWNKGRRPRPQPAAPSVEPVQKSNSPAPLTVPPKPIEPSTPSAPPKPEEKRKKHGTYRISARIEPHEKLVVQSDPAHPYDVRGDATQWIFLTIAIVPSPGAIVQLKEAGAGARSDRGAHGGGGYRDWQQTSASYEGDGSAIQCFKLAVPWEWEDRTIDLVAPAVVFDFYPEGLAMPQSMRHCGPVSPPIEGGSTTIRVLGANPKVRVDPNPLQVKADGWSGTSLDATLELFFEPALGEELALHAVQATLDGRALPGRIDVPVPADATSATDGTSETGVSRKWIAPFLLQEPSAEPGRIEAEVADLVTQWRWTGGPMCQRATNPRRDQPFAAPPFQLLLRGCWLAGEEVTGQFAAIIGMPLYGKARLVDADGNHIGSPLHRIDPRDARMQRVMKGCHADGLRLHCRVHDLSQGPPGVSNGCKLPPRSRFDTRGAGRGSAAEQLEAILADSPYRRVETSLSDTSEFFTPAQPDATANALWTVDVLPDPTARIWLGNYAVDVGNEPIHGSPLVYVVSIEDGLGGKAERIGACRPVLGTLVLETGGPDFRVHEYRPCCFTAQYQHALGHVPAGEVELRWDFALVDADGLASRPAQPSPGVRLPGRVQRLGETFELIVGHVPPQRDVYLCVQEGDPEEGEVRSVDRTRAARSAQAPAGPGWRRIGDAECRTSLALRAAWHAVWHALPKADKDRATERGLPWLADKDFIDWKDRTLSLAVRIEMWDKAGTNLLATSDRLAPTALTGVAGLFDDFARTPPDFVWRDHRFGYVLLALRLRLRRQERADETRSSYLAEPHASSSYRLTFGNRTLPDALTGRHGEIDILAPVRADEEIGDASLVLLNAQGQPNDARFELRLGGLDRVSEVTGLEARLNNLGFFASERVDGQDTAQRRRAVQRFQALRRLRPWTGNIDDIRTELEYCHDVTGVVGEIRRERGDVLQFYDYMPSGTTDDALKPSGLMNDTETEAERLEPSPPNALKHREARVALHLANTLRVPGDWPAQRDATTPPHKYWFWTDPTPPRVGAPMGRVSGGNEVLYLVDGPATYRAMAEVIREASGPNDYIYLLGWFLGMDFELEPGDPHSTIQGLFGEAAGHSIAAAARAVAKRVSELHGRVSVLQDNTQLADCSWIERETRESIDELRSVINAAGALLSNTWNAGPAHPARAMTTVGLRDQLDAVEIQLVNAVHRDFSFGQFRHASQALQRQANDIAESIAVLLAGTDDGTNGRGVQIRAMLWCDPKASPVTEVNKLAVRRINLFTHGAAIHDNLTESIAGAHHQKILIVHHAGKLTAFCGGIDINPDRVWAYQEPGTPNEKGDTFGAPFHDIHCRIRGEGAEDLLRVFMQRWEHHPEHVAIDELPPVGKGILRCRTTQPTDIRTHRGRHYVQIGRTFGVPSRFQDIGNRPYAHAPLGEQTVWRMIRYGIRHAERFIYLEDQYLSSPLASQALLSRLREHPGLEHVTILIPPDDFTAMAMTDAVNPLGLAPVGARTALLRARFLRPLVDEFPDKVRVFVLRQPALAANDRHPARPEHWHTYVHSKTWIFDDQYAIIGSANCGIRSYTNDTEVVAGICDSATWSHCGYHFAHQLRISIWGELLNMASDVGHAELADGVASAVHWLHPPVGARVVPYASQRRVLDMYAHLSELIPLEIAEPHGGHADPPYP